MKRKPTGQKHRPEEMRGQTGWEGRGLSSGAGSPESQDPGDNAASPGEERSGRSERPGVERMRLGTAELIKPPRCGVGRAEGSGNGLKQERGAKRSISVDQKLEAASERL